MLSKQLLDKTISFLQENVKDFEIESRGKIRMFTCPVCNKQTASLMPYSFIVSCVTCRKPFGTIVDVVRLVELDKKNMADNDIIEYLCDKYDLDRIAKVTIEKALIFYKANNFDLLPIQANGKIPIRGETWKDKIYKEIPEWERWLTDNLNIGVKTGNRSNVTILDIDAMPGDVKTKFYNNKLTDQEKKDALITRDNDLQKILSDLDISIENSVVQKTLGGMHIFFKYVEELPKTKVQKYKMDLENDGGYILLFPSKVEDIQRKLSKLIEIPTMSEKLKNLLLSEIDTYKNKSTVEFKEPVTTTAGESDLDSLKLNAITLDEGGRTNFLMTYGGVLRKKLSIDQTTYALNILNRNLCNPSLSQFEFKNICNSLAKYDYFDDKEVAQAILEFLRTAPDNESSERDIKEALGFKKTKISKSLSYLIKEQYVIKKGRMFYLVQKANWKEEFMDSGIEVNFKFPYFHDVATIRYGDMLVIGGKTGSGKSHVCMNIIKRLKQEGIKTHYISLESGNRFAVIARQIGLVEGDFKWDIHYSPEHIEIEKDAITIIDWLLPKDYANTDKIFEYFSQQLKKQGGILIIFVQLRRSGKFFAEDMIDFFPALTVKFIQSDEDNTKSWLEIHKAREPKIRNWRIKIPTFYDWDTKILSRVDELMEKDVKIEI